MAIASNFPAIRPSLNLDFANARTLDPRITFSRASAATYYDGRTVAKAEENLFTNSDGPLQTVVDGAVYNGDGTISFSAATNSSYKVAVKLIDVGIQFTVSVLLSGSGTIRFVALNGSGGALGTYTPISLTGTPTRYSFTVVNNASGPNCGFIILGAADNSAATVKIEKYQFEIRGQATAYTPTTTQPITNYIPVLQTAPTGVPRFDHNPVTGESLGLLIEEQRTNLLTYSEQFDNATWMKSGATVEANKVVAPDGTLSADIITLPAAGNYIYQSFTATFSAGAAYTFSVYTKNSSRALTWGGATPSGTDVFSATPVGNGWYRQSLTRTFTSAGTGSSIQTIIDANYPGIGSFAFWGAQLEAGAFPTSYMKTEASQVTRAADSAQMTGANFSSWYRQDEGTVVAEGTPPGVGSYTIFNIHRGFVIDRIQSVPSYPQNNLLVQINSLTQAQLNGGGISGPIKVAASYKANDFGMSRNGAQAITALSGAIPSPDSLVIGARVPGAIGGEHFSGPIKRLSYYPKRLTNAQLQALTA